MRARQAALAAAICTLAACTDAPTASEARPPAGAGVRVAAKTSSESRVTSSVRWNRTAVALFRAAGGNAGRVMTYLSLAQYRAVLAAEEARHGATRPSLAGAVAGASVVVLSQFYPTQAARLGAELAAQRSAEPAAQERNADFAAGEAIGRAVAAAVLAQAAADNFGLTSPGVPPTGPEYWTSSGAPIVRGGIGTTPFFLTSQSELRAPTPPEFGSPAYLAALVEVRDIAAARTAAQVAVVQKWVPFSGVLFNELAGDLIERYHRSEREAARILAYGNAAAFDAGISCFDSKFAYWYIRPSQSDPTISLAAGLPNHPSYPSAHSCESGAWQGVLTDAFPSERRSIDAIALEANESRIVGGLHYRFDGDAGLTIGRAAARLALQRAGLE